MKNFYFKIFFSYTLQYTWNLVQLSLLHSITRWTKGYLALRVSSKTRPYASGYLPWLYIRTIYSACTVTRLLQTNWVWISECGTQEPVSWSDDGVQPQLRTSGLQWTREGPWPGPPPVSPAEYMFSRRPVWASCLWFCNDFPWSLDLSKFNLCSADYFYSVALLPSFRLCLWVLF